MTWLPTLRQVSAGLADRRGRVAGAAEDGMAVLVIVVVICAVLLVMTTTVFQVTNDSSTTAAIRVNNSEAIYAAEGGLNAAYQAIGNSTTSTMPCGTNALTQTLSGSPRSASVSESITYYGSYLPTTGALSCSSVTSGSATPESAEIYSVGKVGALSDGMEALVSIAVSSSGGGVFDHTIFSNATMEDSSSVKIFGSSTGVYDASVYTNGTLNCDNSSMIYGSIVAQTGFEATSSCEIYANVITPASITLNQSSQVMGNATATSGTITLNSSAKVLGTAAASGAITLNSSSKVGTDDANASGLTAPLYESFPVIPSVSSTSSLWTAQGWTVEPANNDCTNDSGSVMAEIAAMSTATTPTVIQTSCVLSWTQSTIVKLNANLAIFSTGGFSMTNSVIFESETSTVHDLYWIVPDTSGCPTTPANITLSDSSQFNSTNLPLSYLLYTPCTVSITNSVEGSGQIYGGTVTIGDSFQLTAGAPPTPPGSTGGGVTSVTPSIGVVYEREYSH